MNKLGLRITASGEVSEVELSRDDKAEYLVLQDCVGGLIELVHISDELDMWVNEEFLLYAYDINPVASIYYQGIGAATNIHGDVVFTGGVNAEGETIGLGAGQADILRAFTSSVFTAPSKSNPEV